MFQSCVLMLLLWSRYGSLISRLVHWPVGRAVGLVIFLKIFKNFKKKFCGWYMSNPDNNFSAAIIALFKEWYSFQISFSVFQHYLFQWHPREFRYPTLGDIYVNVTQFQLYVLNIILLISPSWPTTNLTPNIRRKPQVVSWRPLVTLLPSDRTSFQNSKCQYDQYTHDLSIVNPQKIKKIKKIWKRLQNHNV